MSKTINEPLPEGLVLGSKIWYYRNGWRVGTLDSVTKGLASVRPDGPYQSAPKNHINVPLTDIKPIDKG